MDPMPWSPFCRGKVKTPLPFLCHSRTFTLSFSGHSRFSALFLENTLHHE